MNPGGKDAELKFWLNTSWYLLSVFIIKWTMPDRIREACCLGEIALLKESYCQPMDNEDALDFEENKKGLYQKYRVNAWWGKL